MEYNLNDIINQFMIESKIEPYGNGHINDTFLVEGHPSYILQKINTKIFKDPKKLMENIMGVTSYLKEKIKETGGNPDRETLTVIKTRTGHSYYCADKDNCFRMYKFIDNASSHDEVENLDQLYNAARAFGRFQKLLSGYPAETLHETIAKFHDTRDRFSQLEEAVKMDKCGRMQEVQAEIDFAFARKNDTGVILDALADGSVPLRVTHNDTKLNNVMLDNNTGEGVCVIDLDTVMPGSALYDYGDALRFAGSSGAEDETDLSKIWFDIDKFRYFTKGYLEELGDSLTKREKELLPFSIKLMTYECGIRFLADYLNGDTYFKIHRKKHNLDRCRTQFKLVADIESKMAQLNEFIG